MSVGAISTTESATELELACALPRPVLPWSSTVSASASEPKKTLAGS
jgi:hypothetical protein